MQIESKYYHPMQTVGDCLLIKNEEKKVMMLKIDHLVRGPDMDLPTSVME